MIRCFAIFAIPFAILLYAPGLRAPLYLDDSVVLLHPHLAWSPRAVGAATFWLNDQINPIVQVVFPVDDSYLFRLGNVFIHALAATSLFWLAYRLSKKWAVAWVAGTLFLVHPIQTQAVTYITQRFESQATLLMLLAAAAYARYRNQSDWRWFVLCMVCGVAAGFTKQIAVIVPLWILLIEAIFFGGREIRKRGSYLLVLAAIVLYPTFLTFRSVSETFHWIRWSQYLLTQGPVLATYFQLIVWPRQQFLFYDFAPVERVSLSVLAQWGVVLAVLAAGFVALRRNRLVGFGILTIFTLLLPVILLPLPDLVFEHRVYPAMAGVALAAAAGLVRLNSRAGVMLFLTVLAPLQYRTMQRNREWVDPVHFLEMHRERFPTDPIILANLSVRYTKSRNDGRGVGSLQNRQAIRRPGEPILQDSRRYSDRDKSGVSVPGGPTIRRGSGGSEPRAEARSTNPDALWVRGSALVARHELVEARPTLRTLLSYEPNNRRAWVMLRKTMNDREDPVGVREIDRRVSELNASPPSPTTRWQVSPSHKKYVSYGFVVLALMIITWIARTLWSLRDVLTRPSGPA